MCDFKILFVFVCLCSAKSCIIFFLCGAESCIGLECHAWLVAVSCTGRLHTLSVDFYLFIFYALNFVASEENEADSSEFCFCFVV